NAIYGNIIYYPRTRNPGISVQDNGPMDTLVYNNTLYGTDVGVSMSDNINTVIRNTVISNSTGSYLWFAWVVSVPTASTNNLCPVGFSNCSGSGDITGSPLFVNAAADNFNLQSGSPRSTQRPPSSQDRSIGNSKAVF